MARLISLTVFGSDVAAEDARFRQWSACVSLVPRSPLLTAQGTTSDPEYAACYCSEALRVGARLRVVDTRTKTACKTSKC